VKAAESQSLVGFALEERYAIVREIGRGGMGVVYEAEHTELGKRVAVKVIQDKYADDDEAIIRFKREALAASRIGSPHIIDVSHIGTAPDGRPFVVMELLEGESLASLLKRTGPMPAWRAIHIMRQVLRATGAAHAKGIVHRDLKPDNIFIVNRDDQQDFVKLLDFGISKFLETGEHSIKTQLTTTGAVMGTPLYMAPEQAMGSPVAPSVDIYACGVLLFEMLSGRPPFNDTNYNMLVAKLLTASPPRLDDLRKGLPRSLVNAVHRALEKEPTARFASAEAFLNAIPSDRPSEELELATTLEPGASLSRPAPITKKTRKRPVRWIAGATALVVGGVLGAAAIITHTGASPAQVSATTPPPTTVPTTTPAPPVPVPVPVPAPTGTLEIKTIPANAFVRLDNRDTGPSPIEVVIAPGRHRVHVELAGYTGVDVDQDVRANERTSATFTLLAAPPTKTVAIKKKPAAAAGFEPINPYAGSAATVAPPPPPTSTTPGAKPNPY
jgi:eukaryotic-like serine/threonine-protein kinase